MVHQVAIKVTIIPTRTRSEIFNLTPSPFERVCAYCRVSTDKEEQETSYEYQVNHYTEYIKSKKEWQFAGIYADEGISGKWTRNRVEFNRMIEDCKAGKIDRIITKSVSRFARNARDCKDYVMQLKELGISVYFEKENLDSMATGTDLVLSILSSMAEQESRDMSTNIKWTMKKKFEKGEFMLNYTRFLGYTRDENKNLIIVPEEAAVVRRIYNEFLSGKTCGQIARELERDMIPSPDRKPNWYSSTVQSILTNEKYCGDALLQKTFSVDFLSKRQDNHGQVEQYHVTDSHPAIIPKEMAELVKVEFEKRANLRTTSPTGHGQYASRYPFSGIVICGNCNSRFRRHSQISGGKTIPIWVCITKQVSHNEKCTVLPIREVVLEQGFIECLRRLIADRENFIDILTANINDCITDMPMSDLTEVDQEIDEQQKLLIEINRQYRSATIKKVDYTNQYDAVSKTLQGLMATRASLQSQNEVIKLSANRMTEMREFLEGVRTLDTFNGDIMRDLIEEVRIMSKHEAIYIFKCGIE